MQTTLGHCSSTLRSRSSSSELDDPQKYILLVQMHPIVRLVMILGMCVCWHHLSIVSTTRFLFVSISSLEYHFGPDPNCMFFLLCDPVEVVAAPSSLLLWLIIFFRYYRYYYDCGDSFFHLRPQMYYTVPRIFELRNERTEGSWLEHPPSMCECVSIIIWFSCSVVDW